jgi:hypothetical protein
MKKAIAVWSSMFLCFFLFKVGIVGAEDGAVVQEEVATNVGEQQESLTTDWKQELSSDRQAIKEQRGQINQNAQESRTEEMQLRDQIKAAMDSGNLEQAAQLREQLKSTHQENVQQMVQDRKDVKIDMQDFKNDLGQAKQEGFLPPRGDRDNNPPGAVGGPGTNWENKPGPQGGPGSSPDLKPRIDRDNNPPGALGGPGTNWENKPGPQGGPGSSPDLKPRIDRDNNPPGALGGPGTNWENKPGPQGGPGVSPDRVGVQARAVRPRAKVGGGK